MLLKVSYEHYDHMTRKTKKSKNKQEKMPYGNIRKAFKSAYYNELKYDFKSAIQYYRVAHSLVQDMPKSYKLLDEIKTVADLLNFKICYLSFHCNVPSEAFSQFHKHIEFYKNLRGDPKKEFVYYAWMARQYKVFGELLDFFSEHFECDSLSKDQALYFNISASLEKARRESAIKILADIKPNIKHLLDRVSPYNPCRIDLQEQVWIGESTELVTFENESDPLQNTPAVEDAYNVLAAQELKSDYGNQILELLNRASAHLKNHGKRRRYLGGVTRHMADEYQYLGFYEVAKKHYDEVLSVFEREKWHDICSDILTNNLKCARSLQCPTEIVRIQLLMLEPKFPFAQETRISTANKLLTYLQRTSLDAPVVHVFQPNDLLVKSDIRFLSSSYRVGQDMRLLLKVKSNFVVPISFKRIEVVFSDADYDTTLDQSNSDESQLKFEPGEIKSMKIDIKASKVGNLAIKNINFILSEVQNPVMLQRPISYSDEDGTPIYNITIDEHDPLLDVNIHFSNPILFGERMPLRIEMNNKGSPITNGKLTIRSTSNNIGILSHSQGSLQGDAFEIPVAGFETNYTETVYLTPTELEPLSYDIIFEFTTETYTSKTTSSVNIRTINPMTTSFDFSMDYKKLHNKLSEGNSFMVLGTIVTHSDLEIIHSKLTPAKHETSGHDIVAIEHSSHKNATILHKGNQFTLLCKAVALLKSNQPLGELTIEWRRNGGEESFVSSFMLPSIEIVGDKKEYLINYKCPKRGNIGKLLDHTITITNTTSSIQEFSLDVSESGHFSVLGDLRTQFKVNPHSKLDIVHKLFPLQTGRNPTPVFSISRTGPSVLLKTILHHVFIDPQINKHL